MGVPDKVVQEILGHSQISMTMDIYSHVLPDMQQDAMTKMNDLFGSGIPDDSTGDAQKHGRPN
jgi:integrase